MKLQELFDLLAGNEFSQLRIGGENEGVINENNYEKVLGHINLGLTAIYKRFNLKTGELNLALQPDLENYHLTSPFAVSTKKSKEPTRYILDADNPFKDDLLKVESVQTDAGTNLALNDYSDPMSVRSASTTYLKVPLRIVNKDRDLPKELQTDHLKISYRASHPKLKVPLGYFDPARVDLELPDGYVQALLLFVASRVHTPMGMVQEGTVGTNWYAKYEAECNRLMAENLSIDLSIQNTRAERGGWA